MTEKATAKICMYRLAELGDCFMLTFSAGASKSRMLVDCGSFRNGDPSVDRLGAVTAAIADDLQGAPIDVVVATHQHNDHVSGFVHCEQAFRDMGVGQVWLSWLDDPKDKTAQKIGEQFNNLLRRLYNLAAAARPAAMPAAGGRAAAAAATRSTRARLAGARPAAGRAARSAGADAPRPAGANVPPPAGAPRSLTGPSLAVLHDILGFYGASDVTPPGLPANAVKILKTLGTKDPEYLRPGRTLDMPGLPAGSVRVHVLGPPFKEADLYRKDPKKGESYDPALAAANSLAFRLFQTAREEGGEEQSAETEAYPFNARYKRGRGDPREPTPLTALVARYGEPSAAWRTIDEDWMQQAEGLALFLDTYTNNSSVVLAIELVASGKVLLFAADAQVGNWASWAKVRWDDPSVSTDDLLARTVFYKVGHHASHNATLVPAFEKVGGSDLVALIPVHKKDPNIKKKNGWKMPAKNLFKRLKEKTEGRVLQMDGVNPPECDAAVNPAKAAWKKVGITPRSTDMAIELEIS